jgi:hypothetical protein
MTIKTTKKSGTQLVCPIKSCGHAEPAPPDLLAELEAGGRSESKKEQEVSA